VLPKKRCDSLERAFHLVSEFPLWSLLLLLAENVRQLVQISEPRDLKRGDVDLQNEVVFAAGRRELATMPYDGIDRSAYSCQKIRGTLAHVFSRKLADESLLIGGTGCILRGRVSGGLGQQQWYEQNNERCERRRFHRQRLLCGSSEMRLLHRHLLSRS
jgi:hypothetical protein